MADTLVLPFAQRLADCLCERLADLSTPVCQCSVRPGTAPPPADACCECGDSSGQAAVQITDIFPVIAGRFPQRISGPVSHCSQFEWAAELTMTVYRCVSVATEDGFPSETELTEDAAKIASDAQAMRQAILCCDWHPGTPPPGRTQADPWPVIPGQWRPLSPLGGCAGGQMSVIVLVGPECCPPVVL